MDDQNKNLILATALSFVVILVWFVMFPPPEQVAVDPNAPAALTENGVPALPTADTTSTETASEITEEASTPKAPRVAIDTPSLSGSISLQGGRIDELSLKNYRTTLDADSEIVQLLSPVGSVGAYQALFDWAPGSTLTFDDVPTPNTIWTADTQNALEPGKPITLRWSNTIGLTFTRTVAVDDDFMFTVTQSVTNTGDTTQRLAPESILERHGEPQDLKGFFILHEGAIRQSDGERDYIKYSNMPEFDADNRWSGGGAVADPVDVTSNGWVGFTDHYWMTTLIPEAETPFQSVLQYDSRRDIYRAIARMATIEVAPGATESVTTRVFAGAKEWENIRAYQNEGKVDGFLDSIDWGWFFFLTKPIFALLHWLNGVIGNMGWSIIALTLIIKAALLPLAYKSYVSMAKMKELQPQMEKLKEAAGDDKQKLQKSMMELYKKEKVNPASGCLPILMQIPIFFSLYKVIFVTLELRHAPFIAWIKDLSAPDPSSLYNLWGILPWDGPEAGSILALMFIGILPLMLGISMWLQQKLNPSPTDATQKMIFAWMPWVFMFMLGSFASGLVVYWIANNTITFIQQYLIMRSQGYKPDVFGNILSSFKRAPKPEDK